MLEGKLAVASFPLFSAMCLFQNRAHGTSSRYKLAITNHHGHDFSIGKLATASFLSSISMCYYPRRKCLCQEESQQSLAFLDLVPCALFKNKTHGTRSRYKLTTTNHHGQGFCIGKLATVSFPSCISMCVYDRRKFLCYKESQQSLAFFDLLPCSYFKIEHMTQAQSISQQTPITMDRIFLLESQRLF